MKRIQPRNGGPKVRSEAVGFPVVNLHIVFLELLGTLSTQEVLYTNPAPERARIPCKSHYLFEYDARSGKGFVFMIEISNSDVSLISRPRNIIHALWMVLDLFQRTSWNNVDQETLYMYYGHGESARSEGSSRFCLCSLM